MKTSLFAEQLHCQKSVFSGSLSFRLESCGVSRKRLPYIEGWTCRSDGYVSVTDGATVKIQQRNGPALVIPDGAALVTRPFWHHKSEIHPEVGQSECIISWAHFHFYLLDSIDLFSLLELPRIVTGPESAVFRRFCTDLTAMRCNPEFTELAIAVKTQKIAFDFLDSILRLMPPAHEAGDRLWEELRQIEPALQWIRRHYRSQLRIEELAARCRLSSSGFHAVFKRVMKTSPVNYAILLRLQGARNLLAGTRLSIQEIARESGYEDAFFFSKLFRKYTGVSPREYRNVNRTERDAMENTEGDFFPGYDLQ